MARDLKSKIKVADELCRALNELAEIGDDPTFYVAVDEEREFVDIRCHDRDFSTIYTHYMREIAKFTPEYGSLKPCPMIRAARYRRVGEPTHAIEISIV